MRSSSREIVEAARPRRRPISRRECPCTLRSAISSRSANERYRPESGIAEDLKIAGGMPPAFRNSLGPTACDTPALSAASSLLIPTAIACQNLCCSARPATGGRPGDRSGARVDRPFRMLIATSASEVLRRPFEPGPGLPCAMVLTVSFVLSPVTGLLSPSPARSLLLTNLTPAPGRQDHTTSPSASRAVRQ